MNERISDILDIVYKEHKIFYCIGDLNIDFFFKCDAHKPTSAILDTIYTYNAFPLITKPTRVTETTATRIDHILTNYINIASEHAQGILCTDILDHYAIFNIAGNIKYDAINTRTARLIRDMGQYNINKFVNEMQIMEWASVTNKLDTQAACSEFHRILCEKYNKYFQYRKLNKPYYSNKPWLTCNGTEGVRQRRHARQHSHGSRWPKYRRRTCPYRKQVIRRYDHLEIWYGNIDKWTQRLVNAWYGSN